MTLDVLKLVVLSFCVGAVLFDVYSRKVPNSFILGGVITVCVGIVISLGWFAIFPGFLSFITVFITGYFLWRFKVLGAGDVKVMAVVALSMTWQNGLEFCFYSFVWGSFLGVISFILQKGLINFVNIFNLNTIMTIRSLGMGEHKVPFTVAILLGVFSVWLLDSKGVHFL